MGSSENSLVCLRVFVDTIKQEHRASLDTVVRWREKRVQRPDGFKWLYPTRVVECGKYVLAIRERVGEFTECGPELIRLAATWNT